MPIDLFGLLDLVVKAAGIGVGTYARQLRAAARGLWSGAVDANEFESAMASVIGRGLDSAWREGAALCGVLPEDRTPEEQQALDGIMGIAYGRVPALAQYIQERNRAGGGKWGALQPRLDLWINRYSEVMHIAQQMSCQDSKLVWRVNPQKESCSTCLKLSGKIYRASTWASKLDVHPQDVRPGKLNCHGWNCGCFFELTTDPITRGRLPTLP